jgi:putative addiction module killer protein
MIGYQIEHYVSPDKNRDLYVDWLRRLQNMQAKVAIARRVIRVEQGNFGDHKFCRDGVWEMRVDVGSGYRVYYAISRRRVVLLLCGGDKRSQDEDIARAVQYWHDWQRRTDDEK